MVAWIRGDGDGDPQTRLFGIRLEMVVPISRRLSGGNFPQVKMGHLLGIHLFGCHSTKAICAWLLFNGPIFIDDGAIDEHHACFLFQRHLSQQVFHPNLNRLAWIFI
ncbi:hypothetical protein SDC9_153237 [bioreactor metagenome]|uniref:Uncharacterized protein n=1 Tax=bioreactor metagenome TaxID=1076179 RepID=A0A645F002_9ZZZZ